jgi:hypothetical protein
MLTLPVTYIYIHIIHLYITLVTFLGIVPDAIQTECAKCSEQQRKQAGKVLAHLLQYKPEYWKMLVQKFDPNNVHLKKYMTEDDENDKASLQKQINGTAMRKK